MQSRNSNSQSRLILIGCLAILLITGVLYFMKRLEASRLSAELSATKTEKREREDDLNGKVTDYLQKMEEMTKQLGNIQSKLSNCEKEKERLSVEAKEAKSAVEECHSQQTQHVQRQGVMEDELNTLRGECQKDKDKVKEHLSMVNQLQQAAKDSEIELDSCQTMSTQCQSKLNSLQAELIQARTRCDQLQSSSQNRPVGNVLGNPAVGGGNPINQGMSFRPKISANLPGQYQPVNNFGNRQMPHAPLNQQPGNQQVSSPNESEKKEPYYPEEKDEAEEEEEKGDPLSDKHDNLFEDEEDNEDEGQDNAPNDKAFAAAEEDEEKVLIAEKELINHDEDDEGEIGEV